MICFSGLNHSKWGVRGKLFVVALIIFAVWELDFGLFDVVFFFVPTTPGMGATSGPRHVSIRYSH